MDTLPTELILHLSTFLAPSSLAALILTSKRYAYTLTKELYDPVITDRKDPCGEPIPWERVRWSDNCVWDSAKFWKSDLISNYFSNVPLESPFHFGSTWVHTFVFFENVHLVELFLTRGADLDAKDEAGRTPLIIATRYSSVDIVRLLLRLGADMLYTPLSGSCRDDISSFECAIRVSSLHLEVVRLFIEAVGDVNIDLPQMNGKSQKPLHIAADLGYPAVTELLLSNGADPFHHSECRGIRQTALHIASRRGCVETCQHLVNAMKAAQNSPGIFPVDERGKCPLACAYSDEVASLLIEAGNNQPCQNCCASPVETPSVRGTSLPSRCLHPLVCKDVGCKEFGDLRHSLLYPLYITSLLRMSNSNINSSG